MLFDPVELKNHELINRFVRSATCEYMADEKGVPDDRFLELYRELALAGIGMVISGYSFVMPNGKSNPGQSGYWPAGHCRRSAGHLHGPVVG